MAREEDIRQAAEEHENKGGGRNGFSFECGVEWAELKMIEKACQWLEKHADGYTWYNEFEGESGMIEEFVDDFRKAMEG